MFELLLDTLKAEMMPLCSQIAFMAKAVAMLGCLVSMAMVTIKYMAEGGELNIWGYAKPLALAFCILTFDTLVIGTLDGILRPISKATSVIAQSQEASYLEKADELDLQMARMKPDPNVVHHYNKNKAGADSMGEEGIENFTPQQREEMIRREMHADVEVRKGWIMSILESILLIFAYAAKMIINIVGTFFLIILAIMGPLAFAAACFPMFENSLSNWMTRYISVSLWIPCANLLTATLSRVQVVLCDYQLKAVAESGVGNSILLLAMIVVGIFGYLSVPSLASWIIQAGGSGSYTRNMTLIAAQFMKGDTMLQKAIRSMMKKGKKGKEA